MPLFNDGYFYRFVFEVRTDENDKLPKAKGERADQYYASEESTHLYALHIVRAHWRQIKCGDAFYECWDSKLEHCPKDLHRHSQQKTERQ